MAGSRALGHAEDEADDGRTTRGSAAGRGRSRAATGRKKTGTAGERRTTRPAGERKAAGTAGERKATRPAGERKATRTAGERKAARTAGERKRSRPAAGRKKAWRRVTEAPLSVLLTAAGVLAAIGILALAGWLLTFPLNDLRYSSGLSGTPGTFTAVQCHTAGGKKGERVCAGTFVAAKGGLVDRSARIRDARIDVGRPAKLRRRPDGGYVQPGPRSAGMNLATAFGIVSLAAFLLVVLCVSPGRVSAGSYKRLRKNPPPWGTLLSVLVPVFGASLALAAVCALTGWVLSLVF